MAYWNVTHFALYYSWFAVHCTSMNNTNRLISSDNKGLAALMFEIDRNGKSVLPGKVCLSMYSNLFLSKTYSNQNSCTINSSI